MEEKLSADKTLRDLRKALKDNKGFIGGDMMQLIHKLSTRVYSIDVEELSAFIRSEVTLTARILCASNKLEFNVSGKPVTTISEAIRLIGFNKIRNLTLSLLLIDNAQTAQDPEEQRKVVASALIGGMLAQTLMIKQGEELSEQAFVSTTLRNYGRILMSAFMLDHYKEAMRESIFVGEESAFNEVFGIEPLAISRSLLGENRMPQPLLNTLQRVSPESLVRGVVHPSEKICVIASLADDLSRAVVDPSQGESAFEKSIQEISQTYQKVVPLHPKDYRSILRNVGDKLRTFNRSYGFQSFVSPYLTLLFDRAAGREPGIPGGLTPEMKKDVENLRLAREREQDPYTRDFLKETRISPTARKMTASQAPKEDLPEAETVFSEAFESMTLHMSGKSISPNRLMDIALQAVARALRLEDAILFLSDSNDTSQFTCRQGIGPLIESFPEKPVLFTTSKDLTGLALTRGDDIHIEDSFSPRIRGYLPKWLQDYSGAGSFALCPIYEDQKPIGLLFLACRPKHALVLPYGVRKLLKALRLHLVTGFNMARRVKAYR